MTPRLTEPRRRGLLVLLAQEQTNPHVKVRSSNRTSQDSPRTVSRQVAIWLTAEGLASSPGAYQLELTDRGRELAEGVVMPAAKGVRS